MAVSGGVFSLQAGAPPTLS